MSNEKAATRTQILDRLKRGGPASAAALARALKLTPMAVRLQLYQLAGESLVEATSQSSGRGRPTKFWMLTDRSARIFPDAHQGLAVDLIRSMREIFGEAGVKKIADTHAARQCTVYLEKLRSAKTLADRVRALAEIRSAEGYMAEAKKDGRDWLFVENHCPICSAAKECTRLCANELSVFQDALGPAASVAREEHILSGARRCAYRIKSAVKA